MGEGSIFYGGISTGKLPLLVYISLVPNVIHWLLNKYMDILALGQLVLIWEEKWHQQEKEGV